MSVVGIDLGTANSCVAVAYKKKISVVPNGMSKWITPTLVGFSERERTFGSNAESQWSRNFKNTISQIKRFLGRKYDDATKKELNDWILVNASKYEEKNDDRVAFDLETSQGNVKLLPEQILPGYFDELKKFTSKFLGGTAVKDCVIACPNYFDDAQRRALLTACKLADFNVLRLMNETTAVALNYGILRQLPEKETRRVMFIDIGYSNTQVCVVDFIKGKLTTYYQSYNSNVGTRDFDKALAEFFEQVWLKKHADKKLDKYPKSKLRLQQQVAKVKKLLSGNKDAEWCIECFVGDYDLNMKITRDEFEEASLKVYDKINEPIIEAINYIKNNDKNKTKLHSVEIVGGGSYIPRVKSEILNLVNKHKKELNMDNDLEILSKTLNGDESVARGCALMCAMLSPNFKVRDFQVCDINNFPILIDYPSSKDGQQNERISKLVIKRGNPSPCNAKISFYKTKNFDINIQHPTKYESKDGKTKIQWIYPFDTCLNLGHFNIELLPFLSNPTQEPKIKVTLNLNRHGVLDFPEANLIEYYDKEVKVPVKKKETPKPEPKKDEKKDEKKPDDKAKKDDNNKSDDTSTKDDENKNDDASMGDKTGDNSTQDKDAEMQDKTTDKPAENGNDKMDVDKDKDKPNEQDKPKTEDKPADKVDEVEYKIEKRKQKSNRMLKVVGKFYNEIKKKIYNDFYSLEAQFLNKDRIIHETNEAKNNLEAYIYESRDKFEGESNEFIEGSDLEVLKKKLERFEDWLYEDGENANKTQYNEKLEELQKIVIPVDSRLWEFKNRGNRIENFKKLVFTYIRFADSQDKKFEHIPKDKKEECKKIAQDCDKWLTDLLIKQDRKNKYEIPVIKCMDIDNKYRELMNKCNPIMNIPKPKPKPKPKPEPKKDDKKDTEKNKDKDKNKDSNDKDKDKDKNTDANSNAHANGNDTDSKMADKTDNKGDNNKDQTKNDDNSKNTKEKMETE